MLTLVFVNPSLAFRAKFLAARALFFVIGFNVVSKGTGTAYVVYSAAL